MKNSSIRNNYALGAVTGGAGDDYVGRIVGRVGDTADIFGNYYIGANTLEGEFKRTILIDEAVEKTVGELKALTELSTQTDFTSTDATDGWNTDSWDFTAEKYPSLKSYKTNASDEQVDGDLLCGQGVDWNLGDEWVQCSPVTP